MFIVFWNRLGCLGSIGVSIALTLLLLGLMRACSSSPAAAW